MSRILAVRIRMERVEGRHTEAVKDCIMALKFGDLIQKDAACLINYLVGIMTIQLALEQAQDLAKDTRISPKELTMLSQSLEMIRTFDRGLVLSINSEYRMAANVIDQLQDSKGQKDLQESIGLDLKIARFLPKHAKGANYFFQPNRSKQMFADFYQKMIRNTSLPYAEGKSYDKKNIGRDKLGLLRPNAIGRLLLNVFVPGVIKAVGNKWQTECNFVGTKLVVACNRFQRDKGRWPDALGELVPDYLVEVPRDPFDGQPFRYSAEKGRVWAVGTNLTDEGGSTRVPGADKEYVASRNRRQAEDFVFELKPTTKAE